MYDDLASDSMHAFLCGAWFARTEAPSAPPLPPLPPLWRTQQAPAPAAAAPVGAVDMFDDVDVSEVMHAAGDDAGDEAQSGMQARWRAFAPDCGIAAPPRARACMHVARAACASWALGAAAFVPCRCHARHGARLRARARRCHTRPRVWAPFYPLANKSCRALRCVLTRAPPACARGLQVPHTFSKAQLFGDLLFARSALAEEVAARGAEDAADACAAAKLAPAALFDKPLARAPFASAGAAASRRRAGGARAARRAPARTRAPPRRPPPPPRPAAAASVKKHTGAAAPWLRAQDGALRDALAAHGRKWTLIRDAVQQRGAFAPLLSHLGAPESKCLRKRADKLAAWDAAGVTPPYRG
jgi:hypothetical protein